MNVELKTSEEWSKDVNFVGLTILDPDGWDRRPEYFDNSWYKERISKKEFENRVCMSTIIWSLPKL